MNNPTIEAYQEVLKIFYRSALKNHSKKNQLNARFLRKILSFGQPQSNKLPVHSQSRNAPLSSTSQRIVPNQPSLVPGNTTIIGKDNNESGSPLLKSSSRGKGKEIASDRSSLSNDNESSHSHRKILKQRQSFFNTQWVYRSDNFYKTFVFAYIYTLIHNNDLYNFTKLSERVCAILENQEDSEFYSEDSTERSKISAAWIKITQTFERKNKIRWTKVLSEIFIGLPITLVLLIFDCLTRGKCKINQNKPPTGEVLEQIRKSSNVGLSFFTIFYQNIQQASHSSEKKDNVVIVYLRSEEEYAFSSKCPSKEEKEKNKEKAVEGIANAIKNLLAEFDANTEKLEALKSIFDRDMIESSRNN